MKLDVELLALPRSSARSSFLNGLNGTRVRSWKNGEPRKLRPLRSCLRVSRSSLCIPSTAPLRETRRSVDATSPHFMPFLLTITIWAGLSCRDLLTLGQAVTRFAAIESTAESKSNRI